MTEIEDQIGLAAEARGAAQEADSSQEEAARLREQLREEMLTTISEMREATGRIGPFGAQIGEGNNSAFVLSEPLVEKKSSYPGGKEVEHHTYIVATTSGFKGIEVVSDKDYLPGQYEDEQILRRALNSAKGGVVGFAGQQIPGYWNHGGVRELVEVPVVGKEYCREMGGSAANEMVSVSSEQVREALRSNIAAAQAPHKDTIASATANIATAASVRDQLK